ncbi:hypothetical protein ABFS82_09G118900 [Erythranthe guttata]|uniref:glycine-rich RNA-binding protein 3, mitochondrial-like n=1 Tax=Erythranthe guttata TaxID=4155 RepID=UPI00064DCFDD|nr:PREDICTED: glycine-rich RNA-binding protein 3, mitochondrial-like [Erythranthe guttata]XP_012856684.1 PREDICTED: glycine-rich RNA-binding protein 3, mitochondrial-like [Erythranthe guttata]|eukprot:XP_012856683.1 PREDICTED: glycine-rich RNA-binding protein 3, mitochondrial-like [Erythranthe guttata]
MDYGVPEQNIANYGEEEPPQYEARRHYEAEEGNYGSIDNVDDSAGVKHDSSSSSSSAGKLFVGGIAWETSEESFSRYFRKYGEITDSVIMMDKISGRPRGFGFVTFADADVADKVLQEDHVIDGRAVEVKRTVPREDVQGRGVLKTKKIFVGGLPLSLNEDDLREYFSSYGDIMEHQIMLDHKTGRSRGFGFVTFESEDAVEKIFSDGQMHEISGKQVEIKRAEPKRSGFDHSTEGRFHRGSTSLKSSGNFAGGLESFGGGYGGGKMGRGYGGGYGGGSYGGYGGYGNFAGSYPGGAAGYYAGYGGYGYGYGFGGPMYSGGAYGGGGGGYGAPVGYGGAAGYGLGKGYGGPSGGYDGGKGFSGGGSGSNGGGYGPTKGYTGGGSGGGGGGAGGGSGGYGSSKGYGNGNAPAAGGRFHPYRK